MRPSGSDPIDEDEAWMEALYASCNKALSALYLEVKKERERANERWPDRANKLKRINILTQQVKKKLGDRVSHTTQQVLKALVRAWLGQYGVPSIADLEKKPLSRSTWEEQQKTSGWTDGIDGRQWVKELDPEDGYRQYVIRRLGEQMEARLRQLEGEMSSQEAEKAYRDVVEGTLWVDWIDRVDELDWEEEDQMRKVWDEYVAKVLSVLGWEEISPPSGENVVVRRRVEVGSDEAEGWRAGEVVRVYCRRVWDPTSRRPIRPGEVTKVVKAKT